MADLTLNAALGDAAAFIRNPVAFLLDGPENRWWRIKSLDPELPLDVQGDFRPRGGVRMDASANYAVSQGLNDQGELVQFLAGSSDRCSVTVELFSDNPRDSLRARLDQLLSLVRRNGKLKRPPKCRFSWGTEFSRDVFFQQASPTIVRLWPNGSMAEVSVDLAMIEAPPAAVESTSPTAIEHESLEVVAQPDDTFELLAARYYGDPDKGVLLLQRHPDVEGGILQAGTRVLVVDRDHSTMQGQATFVSPPLEDGDDMEAAWTEHLTDRAGSRVLPG